MAAVNQFLRGVNKLPKPIKETINSADGHIYYVIEAEGTSIFMGIKFLNNYDDLVNYVGEPGLFLVRDAAHKAHFDRDNNGNEVYIVDQNGDPTVHEGWAMYCWDTLKEGNKGGWRKVAEQESVDGPWGIDERILKMLVSRKEWNEKEDLQDQTIDDLSERVQTVENNVNGINETITELQRKSHEHSNKDVLDALSAQYGQIKFNDKAISNTFLYDCVEDGKLIWRNPINPTYGDVVVSKSIDIATRLANTVIGAAGLNIAIFEVDGSITRYQIIKGEDGRRVARFLTTTMANSYGNITYVATLPEASSYYVDRGVWCPLNDDGTNTPGRFYICKVASTIGGVSTYKWYGLDEEGKKGQTLSQNGAMMYFCISDSDPEMPYKRNHLFWYEPRSVFTEDDITFSFDKTYVVRKFGSVPQNINDGTVVCVADKTMTNITRNGFVDTCPYSNQPVYYQLFSFTKSGAIYKPYQAAGVVPSCITWDFIKTKVKSVLGANELTRVIKMGDMVILPEHPTLGVIKTTVESITNRGMTLNTVDPLVTLDASEAEEWVTNTFSGYTQYAESNDGVAKSGKSYFYYDDGFKPLEIEVGEQMPEGLTVYESTNGVVDSVTLANTETEGDIGVMVKFLVGPNA